jgi:hypothetical protein
MYLRQIRFSHSVGAPTAPGVSPSERTFFDVPELDAEGKPLHHNNIAPDQHLRSIELRDGLVILTNAKGYQRVTPMTNMIDGRPLETRAKQKGEAA